MIIDHEFFLVLKNQKNTCFDFLKMDLVEKNEKMITATMII